MSNATKGALLFIGLILFVGMIFGLGMYSWYTQRFVTGGEVRMVQPSGMLPDLDAHYAQEVNVPNSEANLNNGQGRYFNAQATAIVGQSNIQQGQTYKSGLLTGWSMAGMCMGSLLVVLLLVGHLFRGSRSE